MIPIRTSWNVLSLGIVARALLIALLVAGAIFVHGCHGDIDDELFAPAKYVGN